MAALAGAFTPPPVAASAADTCASASSATFRHTFDGASGKATVTAVRALCAGQSQAFGLVSYTDGGGGRFTYATDRATITAKTRTVRLDVVVPPCRTQVFAIRGSGLLDEVTSGDNPYGGLVLGDSGSKSNGPPAHYRGGSAECSPEPKVTFTSACDGTYRATLENAPSANVSATFLIAGQVTRLAPGRSTTVKGPRDGSLTVRVNTFTTYVGNWRPPAAGCSTTAAPAASTPAAAPPQPPAAALPSAPGTTVPTATTTTETDSTPGVYFPPAQPATAAAAEAERPGMSTGSMLAVAFGLLLIGGGGYFLVRVLRGFRDPH
ncbi:hypothetical protein OWR29_29120 [Actinoplanes sp. Pm04-4]|uniref:Uncharacterized protein n=1 Tax=Paractinoplanes pyxinae TaxID=2997416 RepID=A0ABT4B883_9ACTN|nr:hypothetical protein [Actinoplanes pyxinae]MCY1142075.1 hypothetical protein [Actinoplanes pyxinae]